MPKIKCRDLNIYYEEYGYGVPIVFIPGFSADHTLWAGVINEFQDNYRVVVLDNRGSGQSDVPKGPYTIKEMADDVAILCENLGIYEAHFVGSSMGGFILQTLAFSYPQLVKSATISHSTSHIATPFHLYLKAQLMLLKSNAPFDAIVKASCAWVFSFQFLSRPGMLDLLVQMKVDAAYPFTIEGYEGQFAALEQFDSRAWANQIKAPTLVLASDQDLIFSEYSVKELTKLIPNTQYYCFSDCGHLPPVEYPQLFAEKILAFINKQKILKE